jgi:glycosyltransferase involved in cell wall biosynthesis
MRQKFTVLIPARGKCEFIVEAIESIFLSSLPPDEVLIVDDGIIQTTKKVILSLKYENKIRIIDNEGTGLVEALNTGIQSARNEFIFRLDSDDMVTGDRFLLQIKAMDDEPSIVAVGSQVRYLDGQGILGGFSSYPVGELNYMKLEKGCFIAHPSILYLRSRVIDCGSYRKLITFKGTDLAEDYDLWLRLVRMGKIINLGECLTLYRQHESQLSVRNLVAQQFATIFIKAINFPTFSYHIEKELDISVQSELDLALDIIRKILPFKVYIEAKILSAQIKRPQKNKFHYKIIRKALSFFRT